jgi:2-keto-3-deoxy-L-rhamnonate aldolase RhmA
MTDRYPLTLMLMTRDPGIAAEAARAGVDRLFVDLEVAGKAERQAGRNTIISAHTVEDVRNVRGAAPNTELMARINPPSPTTAAEVDAVIAAGADVVMLPMFTHADEVQAFVEAIRGRARVCLLLETAAAVVRVRTIAAVPGIDEIHVGLNDLHISTGIDFMFELLGEGLVQHLRDAIREVAPAIRFGFGGGARLSAPHPVTPADVLGEHVRLGSRMIILSRTFLEGAESLGDLAPGYVLADEVAALRAAVEAAVGRSPDEVEATRLRVQAAARHLGTTLRARRQR